jgi:hypothetical protein
MSDLLTALPAAATNPLAFIAYGCHSGMDGHYSQNRRFKTLIQHIEKLPEKDRKDLLARELNVVLPEKITAQQWLAERRQRYFLVGFVVLIVFALAFIALIINALQTSTVHIGNNTFISMTVIQSEYKQKWEPAGGPKPQNTYMTFEFVQKGNTRQQSHYSKKPLRMYSIALPLQ